MMCFILVVQSQVALPGTKYCSFRVDYLLMPVMVNKSLKHILYRGRDSDCLICIFFPVATTVPGAEELLNIFGNWLAVLVTVLVDIVSTGSISGSHLVFYPSILMGWALFPLLLWPHYSKLLVFQEGSVCFRISRVVWNVSSCDYALLPTLHALLVEY